jgi:hypothetical protein
VLEYLRNKAQVARLEGEKSPIAFRGQDGNFLPLDLIRVLQDRQKGAFVGFTALDTLLTSREQELREKIEQEEKDRLDANNQQ